MALQTSGKISILDIVGEFGGSAPHALSEYYSSADGVPESGEVSISDFYGAQQVFEHAYRHLATAETSSVNVTVPTGVKQSSRNPVVFALCITWDGVSNSSNNPTVDGRNEFLFNTGGAFRGDTKLVAARVPEGQTVNCSFSPGGGFDERYIMVWCVFDTATVAPDITFKTESSSPSAREFTVDVSQYDPSSCFAIAENWQGGTNTWTSPIVQGGHATGQGNIRNGYNPTPRNEGTASNTNDVFFENNFGNGCCGEESFCTFAFLKGN